MGAKAVAMVDEVVLEMVEEEEEEEEEDVVDNLQRKILGSVTMLNYVALDDLNGSCALIYIYIYIEDEYMECYMRDYWCTASQETQLQE